MISNFYSYLPERASAKCASLVKGHNVMIRVVRNRKTKHGDFRVKPKGKVSITINAIKNPYLFLLTFLHEWGHYNVFSSYAFRKKPHGKEWKSAFQQLVYLFLGDDIFPHHLSIPLRKHMLNPKATFAADLNLTMALREFDPPNNKKCIFELDQGTIFNVQDGRVFSKDFKQFNVKFK